MLHRKPLEWPLPGLVELAAARDSERASRIWGYVPWAQTGALAALGDPASTGPCLAVLALVAQTAQVLLQ